MNILEVVGRSKPLLVEDVAKNEQVLQKTVAQSRFLIVGGAGSIGQAVTKEIFSRDPKALHVVDLSENNLVELVRDIRSSFGYIGGDFRTYALDCGSKEFEKLVLDEGQYDYVLNLSALKHVRSEKDPYTLIRMIDTNILNSIKILHLAEKIGAKKFFCVSTDKAANPANMMGASKRIMEMFLLDKGSKLKVSMARFANVAFSDGSLLHGFNQRIRKNQPIAAPDDVRRYFVTPSEAGELCLMSTILGNDQEIFFPKLSAELNLVTFSSIAERYLESEGLDVKLCSSEEEARVVASGRKPEDPWPCVFSSSDTSGEKDYEEFYTENEKVELDRFQSLGVVVNSHVRDRKYLNEFMNNFEELRISDSLNKEKFVQLFQRLLPEFHHKETGKSLDSKM